MPLTGFTSYILYRESSPPRGLYRLGRMRSRLGRPPAKGLWVRLPPAPLAWQQATSARGLGRARSAERLTRTLDTTE